MMNAIRRISCDCSASSNTTMRPTGTIIAPPTPCAIRMMTSATRLWLNAQPSDAAVKIAIAQSRMRRYPYRSVSQPLSGIVTATVTR